jgi:hypothetical protein
MRITKERRRLEKEVARLNRVLRMHEDMVFASLEGIQFN